VFAYWKILVVVRRQAKVTVGHRRITVTANEPVAGTSEGTAVAAVTSPKSETDKEVNKVAEKAGRSKGRGEVRGQNRLSNLSQARINVIKTMMSVIVCFVICYMPMNVYLVIGRVTVRQIKSLLTIVVSNGNLTIHRDSQNSDRGCV